MCTQPYSGTYSGIQFKQLWIDEKGKFKMTDHENLSIRMTKNIITIGCTQLTPDTLKELLKRYEEKFPKDEVIIQ